MKNNSSNIEINEHNLLKKFTSAAYSLSKATLGLILTLYYAAKDPKTPKWAKTVIILALSYFIMPIDSIPDFVPTLGFTDDFAAISSAFATVAAHINDEHKKKAERILAKFFRK